MITTSASNRMELIECTGQIKRHTKARTAICRQNNVVIVTITISSTARHRRRSSRSFEQQSTRRLDEGDTTTTHRYTGSPKPTNMRAYCTVCDAKVLHHVRMQVLRAVGYCVYDSTTQHIDA